MVDVVNLSDFQVHTALESLVNVSAREKEKFRGLKDELQSLGTLGLITAAQSSTKRFVKSDQKAKIELVHDISLQLSSGGESFWKGLLRTGELNENLLIEQKKQQKIDAFPSLDKITRILANVEKTDSLHVTYNKFVDENRVLLENEVELKKHNKAISEKIRLKYKCIFELYENMISDPETWKKLALMDIRNPDIEEQSRKRARHFYEVMYLDQRLIGFNGFSFLQENDSILGATIDSVDATTVVASIGASPQIPGQVILHRIC